MQIEYLYYFLDVARTLSISQSAKELFISPQGLSQAIKSLEKEYNIELFARTKYGFVLTSEGEEFAVCAKEFLKSYERFLARSHSISPVKGGEMGDTLTIYTTALFSVSGIILDMFNIFLKNMPNSKFLILEQLPFDTIKSLIQDQNNSIGLVNIPSYALEEFRLPEGFSYDYLLEISMVANVSPNSVYASKKFFTKQELAALPLSCFNEPLIVECIRFMLGQYGEPNIVLRSSNVPLSQGMGFSQDIINLSVNLIRNFPQNNRVMIPVRDTLKLAIILLYRESQKGTPLMKTVISLIKSYLLENYPHLAMKEKPVRIRI